MEGFEIIQIIEYGTAARKGYLALARWAAKDDAYFHSTKIAEGVGSVLPAAGSLSVETRHLPVALAFCLVQAAAVSLCYRNGAGSAAVYPIRV